MAHLLFIESFLWHDMTNIDVIQLQDGKFMCEFSSTFICVSSSCVYVERKKNLGWCLNTRKFISIILPQNSCRAGAFYRELKNSSFFVCFSHMALQKNCLRFRWTFFCSFYFCFSSFYIYTHFFAQFQFYLIKNFLFYLFFLTTWNFIMQT